MTYDKNDILDIFYKAGLGKDWYFTEDIVNNEFWFDLQNSSNHYFDEYYVGATKAVFIPFNTDYVIKIPFNAIEYYDDVEGSGDTVPFDFADGTFNNWDYCAVESERYFLTESYGLEKLFVPTIFIGYVRKYPVYIQPRCATMNKAKVSSEDSKIKVNKICDKIHARSYIKICDDWLGAVLETYGEKMVENLLHFLIEEGWNDFHSGNVGFYKGNPVIFDYSDFNE